MIRVLISLPVIGPADQFTALINLRDVTSAGLYSGGANKPDAADSEAVKIIRGKCLNQSAVVEGNSADHYLCADGYIWNNRTEDIGSFNQLTTILILLNDIEVTLR